jgi:flagellar basal-body rod modification protein FlgD
MFLQLLVAQLKYQSPSSPQDPTQFVGELAQFSQLEQTLGIKQDTDTIVKDISAAATTAPATTTPTTTPTMTQSPAATQAT